ncbi:MAG TPA: hypothetical protein VGA69_08700 [Nitriliruptorales bacterium]
MTLAGVLDRLRERAESEPAFADTLQHLADAADVHDPFGEPPADVRHVARQVNRQRQDARFEELAARSLTTMQVVDLLASVSDRKGVDRRRHRATLLGILHGNRMLHPRWQFDRRRRETYQGLDELLEALRQVAADDLDADAIAVTPRADAGGSSVADLLAEGDVAGAVALAHLAGDQS